MPQPADHSEPILLTSEPISVAVNEYVAARRLGLSVDTLRRDRRLGHLGIPFIKIGSGKHGTVRYDLVDLGRFLEARKRRALPPVAAPEPPVEQPEPPGVSEQRAEMCAEEPPRPCPSPPRTPWGTLAETVQIEPEDDPFRSNVVTRRRGPIGYFGG
jgi:hypothetical protein